MRCRLRRRTNEQTYLIFYGALCQKHPKKVVFMSLLGSAGLYGLVPLMFILSRDGASVETTSPNMNRDVDIIDSI